MNQATGYYQNPYGWLAQVPYGGYAQGPIQVGQQGRELDQPQPWPQYPTGSLGVLGMTALGLAIFGGAGALLGILIGGTQKAALVGALLGVSAPPLYAAARSA